MCHFAKLQILKYIFTDDAINKNAKEGNAEEPNSAFSTYGT